MQIKASVTQEISDWNRGDAKWERVEENVRKPPPRILWTGFSFPNKHASLIGSRSRKSTAHSFLKKVDKKRRRAYNSGVRRKVLNKLETTLLIKKKKKLETTFFLDRRCRIVCIIVLFYYIRWLLSHNCNILKPTKLRSNCLEKIGVLVKSTPPMFRGIFAQISSSN